MGGQSSRRAFRSCLAHDLLILDALGLDQHWFSDFIISRNRAVDESLSLFDDPILSKSALDRLTNARYQVVIEGTSYREQLSPQRASKVDLCP